MTNPSAHDLYPDLCRASTTERACYLQAGVTTTFVVPGDWISEEEATARIPAYASPSMLGEDTDPWHNDIDYFISGRETFAAILEDLASARRAGARGFVGHVGWTCWQETGFGGRSTYASLMAQLVAAGVKTRALYWIGTSLEGELRIEQAALYDAATGINALTPTGVARAFVDERTENFGSHHQKLWLILGERGLSAYFGGVDVHPNRVLPGTSSKDPWHDVHARVQGPAAERFLGIFLWRLMAALDFLGRPVPAPDAAAPAPGPSSRPFVDPIHPDLRPYAMEPDLHQADVHSIYELWDNYKRSAHPTRHFGGRNPCRARAGSTIGNPQLQAAGFQDEILAMVQNGIERARRFVYVEDQYFWHTRMARLLGERVRDNYIKQLIIVTNVSSGLAEHPQYTQLALRHLAYAAQGRVDRILVFERTGTHGRYVHAKALVYDDVAAHVGSANFNRRGYSHDSESAGIWVDRVVGGAGRTHWSFVGCSLARKLRTSLWHKHLGVPTRHLFDALGASEYWVQAAGAGGVSVALVDGGEPLSVQIATVEGQLWGDWARAQTTRDRPGDDIAVGGLIERREWLIDPE